MEKLVYLILSRDKDKFNVVYVGDCEKTEDKSFFTQNSNFKCWIKEGLSEKSLYLAILPMFESSADHRIAVINKIKSRYNPICNSDEIIPEKPDYSVRNTDEKVVCLCCGAEMKKEKVLEKSSLYRCTGCGISDTKLNS